ncbi:MAG: DNA-binding protein [Oscillospiraceae bacterium]
MEQFFKRLHRGDDLLAEISALAAKHNIKAGVILSGVGCVLRAKIRDAGGITVHEIDEPCEIVSIGGTVSAARCHIHISLSKEDLSAIGGHLMEGTVINTTCELVIGTVDNCVIASEFDAETGYVELVFEEE